MQNQSNILYMNTKIYFANIVNSQHCIVSIIWSIMSGTIVERNSCWKSLSSFQTFFFYYQSQCMFYIFSNINHGFDPA
jgi:hypothetical protein